MIAQYGDGQTTALFCTPPQPVFVNKVLLALSHAITDMLYAPVALTGVSMETVQPMLPKIWTVGLCREKFTDL